MKYFCYVNRHGQHNWTDLISEETSRVMRKFFSSPYLQAQFETFETIQDYDKDGQCIGMPLIADIDSPLFTHALNITMSLCADLSLDFDIDPLVFFSGSKGFHIISPLYIAHHRAHEICQAILTQYSNEIDKRIYTNRRLIRCENSWHSKTNLYKTLIPHQLLHTMSEKKIKEYCAVKKDNETVIKYKNNPLFNELIENQIKLLPVMETKKIVSHGTLSIPECIHNILKTEVPVGQRNATLYVVAITLKQSGMDSDQITDLLSTHPSFKSLQLKEINKVIHAVFTKSYSTGCKTSSYRDILRDKCIGKTCLYHEDNKLSDYITWS